jgi:hypothetical protein
MTGSLQEKNNKYYIVLSMKVNDKWKTKWVKTGLDVKGNKLSIKFIASIVISLLFLPILPTIIFCISFFCCGLGL